jgi:hypothetical protein
MIDQLATDTGAWNIIGWTVVIVGGHARVLGHEGHSGPRDKVGRQFAVAS